MEAALQGGLRITDLEGRNRSDPVGLAQNHTDPAAALPDADVILVTVKSGADAGDGRADQGHARPDAVVVSLQNGVDNADRLRAGVDGRTVLAGMVPFNVVQSPDGELPFARPPRQRRQGDDRDGDAGLARLLAVEGFAVEPHADMKAVLWGKLLMNLNNALVALSGLPLATEPCRSPLAADPGRPDRRGAASDEGI